MSQIPVSLLKSQVAVADGTAGAPSVSFSNDTNTGIYRAGTDALGMVTAGVERMRVGSTGNVGIGTTNPTARLHVEGDVVLSGASRFIGTTTNHSLSLITNNTDRMTVLPNGNVGIGTINPKALLHCTGNTESDNRVVSKEFLLLVGRYTIIHHRSDGYEFLVYRNNNDSEIWYADLSIAFYMQIPGFSGDTLYTFTPSIFNSSYYQARLRSTIDGSKPVPPQNTTYYDVRLYAARITNDSGIFKGNIGIGTTNPIGALTLKQTNTGANLYYNGGALRFIQADTTNRWDVGHVNGSTDPNWALGYNGVAKGYFNHAGGNVLQNFTGQHRCLVRNHGIDSLKTKEGLIVVAKCGQYLRMSGGLATGIEAITINESLPVVDLATQPMDPAVFGVLSLTEDPEKREDAYGSFVTPYPKECGDNRVYVNSVGEGAVWVCDAGGLFQSGDYITTSQVPGYGTKQGDNVLYNYTVAKVTMDCDFEPLMVPKKRIKRKPILQTVQETEDKEVLESLTKIEWDSVLEKYVQNVTLTTRIVKEDIFQEFDLYDVSGSKIIGKHKVPKMIDIITEVNDLDEYGNIQWEDNLDDAGMVIMEPEYKMRYLLQDSTIITKEEYDSRKAAGESVYRAAFVGCTYHCG